MTAYAMESVGTGFPDSCRKGELIKITVDVPAEIARLGIASFGATDTLKLFTAPKGMFVQNVGIHARTAEGATATVDVGYTGTAAGFLDDADINSTTPAQAANTFTGKLFTAATDVIATFNTASTDKAIFDLFFIVYNAE